MLFRPTIEKEIRKRKISLLLHSTHLYINLPLILSDGKIHTVRELIVRHGKERAARLLHDPKRYEQLAVGLEYINCSLTIPNVELLYHRSKSDWKNAWVHLSLDLTLLGLPDTRFSPVSAAAERGKYIASGLNGFRAFFAKTVAAHARRRFPSNEPTHPQAEILIKGPLDLSMVKSILVPDREAMLEVSRLGEHHGRVLSIQITPHLFVWPARFLNSAS